jgi:ABC-2 type transport system permease protein
MTVPAGTVEQIRTVAWLRYRLFRNSLRTASAKLDLLARAAVVSLGSLLVLGIGSAMGVGAFLFAKHGQFNLLSLLFWGVFLLWHIPTVLAAAAAPQLEFRNLLRFPLRYPAFFLLSLAYGLLDIGALMALFSLLCMTLGGGAARPALFPILAVVSLLFSVLNLLLGRALANWFERLLATRRAREIAGFLFLLAILAMQFSGMSIERWGRQLGPVMAKAQPALALLPPGLAGGIVAGAARGGATVLGGLAGLAVYAAGFAFLLDRRLRAQYHGEDFGEAPVAAAVLARPLRARAAAETPRIRLLAAPVAAVVRKEVRYVLRNTSTLMLLLLPLLILFFFNFAFGAQPRPRRRELELFRRLKDFAFPASVAYVFSLVGQLSLNCFGFDGRGVQLFFLAPVRFRDVLLGKNLTFAAVLLVETSLVGLIVSLMGHPPGLALLLATLFWLAFATLVQFMAGAWLSLQFPQRVEFGFKQQRASGVTMLLSMVLLSFVMSVGYLVIAAARLWRRMWIAPVVFLLLSAIALAAYRRFLVWIEGFAATQRENLFSKLVR